MTLFTLWAKAASQWAASQWHDFVRDILHPAAPAPLGHYLHVPEGWE